MGVESRRESAIGEAGGVACAEGRRYHGGKDVAPQDVLRHGISLCIRKERADAKRRADDDRKLSHDPGKLVIVNACRDTEDRATKKIGAPCQAEAGREVR